MVPLLFLAAIALAIALRRAFVRIEQLEREVRVVRGPLAPPHASDAPRAPLAPPLAPAHAPDAHRAPLAPPRAPDALDAPGAPYAPHAPHAPRAPRAPHAPPSESLESQIGSRWLLYVGVVAIVIGVAYFEKLAFDNQWIGPTARIVQGAIGGLVLIYAGIRFARAGYGVYGQMLEGCGAAILFVSTYAAFNFYQLIDRPAAFALMVAITGATAVLADRQRSQGLAVMAVGGGFATPFLLPGSTDAQLALFGYDAILIGGTMYLSHRRAWPVLNVVSYAFTVVTVAAWADRFYTYEKYLRTEIFLSAFCAMFLYILHECRRASTPGGSVAALVLWTSPVVYYVASLIILFNHPTAALVWFVGIMLAGAVLAARTINFAGLAVWCAVTLPLLLWIQLHARGAWLAPGLATVGGVYAIALITQLYSSWQRGAFDAVDAIWLHLNGLLMFAGAYFLIDPVRADATGMAAGAFAAWHGALAVTLLHHRRDQALHFAALAFTLLMIAIALQFNGPAITVGWAAEGAVVIALGLHERREWLRLGGGVLFTVAVGRAVLLVLGTPIYQEGLLNSRAGCALFVAVLCYVLAWLHRRRSDVPASEFAIAATLVAAQIVTLALVTGEIHVYWAAREGALARQLMLSVSWAAYATLLIVIGLRTDYAPIRYFAMLVFGVTTLKVFAVDMDRLERVYRILSIVGLGVMLLLTSYLYQRSRKPMASSSGPIDDTIGRR
ncbi:MAG TPA: DUF2339 domain-containing protein [Vicinamibacterales bacterium]|nr:DUF2339 domain-containing protein [Vicinamibacterales bacterium]